MMSSHKDWQMPRIHIVILFCTAFLFVLLYLAASAVFDGFGFPLDDAWIHQTYARNLARNGRWAFIPGEISGGSTSPLWTMLLAVGYLIRFPYLWWAYWLGFLSLLLVGFATYTMVQLLWPRQKKRAVWVAVAVMGTWPLVWAAASGMETLLFVGWGLLLFALLFTHLKRPFQWRTVVRLGISAGLLVMIRPDGLLPIVLILVALLSSKEKRLYRIIGFCLAVTAVLLPYFLFNYGISGTLWPNTLYAKQAEYAVLLEEDVVSRFFKLLYFSLGGASTGWRGISAAHLLLLPGLFWAGWHALTEDWAKKRVFMLLPLLWAGGHVALYAWRLPLTFQHGRYLMAATPIWIIYGFVGWAQLWQLIRLPKRIEWLLRQSGILTYGLLTFLFLLLGAQAYGRDVAFIENEMVAMAKWIADHTPEDALLASHDIGAIGYFAERPLLDLAGLISPEVVPYINDEAQLARFLIEKNAEYLVTAPGWPYDEIVANGQYINIHTTNYPFTQQNGLNNMTIYLLKSP